MIRAEVTKGRNLPSELRSVVPKLSSAVDKAVLRLALKMTALVKTKLSGQVLKVRTGTLRRSINYKISRPSSQSTEAIVGTNVKYAAIHEYGGTIPARIVYPRTKMALKFQMAGKTVFAKKAMIPSAKMPVRSFLRASLAEMTPEIKRELEAAVRMEFRK